VNIAKRLSEIATGVKNTLARDDGGPLVE